MKKVIAAMLLLSLAFGLCACVSTTPDSTVGSEDTKVTEPSQTATQETEETGEAYVVTVVDGEDKPVSGAVIQLCKIGGDGSCTPGMTDAEGKATYKLEKAEYKVSFVVMPAGYTYADEVQEFHFEEGAMELTITVKKA